MATGHHSRICVSVVGPVPFKDIGDAYAAPAWPPCEYDNVVDALPRDPKLGMCRYQGTWVPQIFARGTVAMHRGGGGFTPRRGDVVLASLPKSGTTWLKALAFATMARGTHPPAAAEGHPLLRLNPHEIVLNMEQALGDGWKVDALPSPRLMSTHLHHSLLHPSVTENPDCKIVYICREQKDRLVSGWHFWRTIHPDATFSDLFEAACDGSGYGGPVWEHMLGYWNASRANPETVLFLRYEDMLQDPAGNVRKLARFIGQPFTPSEEEAGVVANVVNLCSFENLKNLDVNKNGSFAIFQNKVFFRKGKVGDWKNHMTPEMAHRLDALIEEKFQGSGLAFP